MCDVILIGRGLEIRAERVRDGDEPPPVVLRAWATDLATWYEVKMGV